MRYVWIAAGGALGAAARWGVAQAFAGAGGEHLPGAEPSGNPNPFLPRAPGASTSAQAAARR